MYAVEDTMISKEIEINNELNHLHFGMTDSQEIDAFVLTVQHKEINDLQAPSKSHPNVYIITLDETSANHFQRKLPKSWAYLSKEMKAVNYPLYSALREGSAENIQNILTGIF